jgi:hypothetical protein
MRFCHLAVREKPSKLVEPIITATNSSAPATGSDPARPVNGQRTMTRLSRTANGAMRENSWNITAKPSPPRDQASRPYTAMPASAQYE